MLPLHHVEEEEADVILKKWERGKEKPLCCASWSQGEVKAVPGMNEKTCCSWRPFGSVTMGAKPRLSLGHKDMCLCCWRRPVEGTAIGTKPRLSMEWGDMHHGYSWRPFGCVEVGAKLRLSVEWADMCQGCWRRPFGCVAMGKKPRLSLGWMTCLGAASGGHLEVLQWARNQVCPWNCRIADAATEGHFELLQWARSQGCPCLWSTDACSRAAGGHFEIL